METKTNKKVEEYKRNLVEVVIPELKKELKVAEEIVETYMKKKDEAYRVEFEKMYGFYSPFDYRQNLQDKIHKYELETLPKDKKFFNEYFFSDVKAYFCVEEINPNKVVVVEFDITREKDAEPYTQAWIYNYPKDIEKCVRRVLRRTKRGTWHEAGNCNNWYLQEEPHYYYDFEY